MAERVQRLVRGEKELLANVSHELRSPLARLRMALALLPRTPADETRLVEAERDVAERERHDPAVAGREVRVADGETVTLVADETLLRRALWNLVENAAKYGAP